MTASRDQHAPTRPPPGADLSRRDQLLSFIASSRRTQRRLIGATVVGFGSAAVLRVLEVGHSVPAILAIATLMLLGMGLWITGSHITDWQDQLSDLRGAPAPDGDVGQRHRDP